MTAFATQRTEFVDPIHDLHVNASRHVFPEIFLRSCYFNLSFEPVGKSTSYGFAFKSPRRLTSACTKSIYMATEWNHSQGSLIKGIPTILVELYLRLLGVNRGVKLLYQHIIERDFDDAIENVRSICSILPTVRFDTRRVVVIIVPLLGGCTGELIGDTRTKFPAKGIVWLAICRSSGYKGVPIVLVTRQGASVVDRDIPTM